MNQLNPQDIPNLGINRLNPDLESLLVEIIEQDMRGLCTPEQAKQLPVVLKRKDVPGLSALGVILAQAIMDRNALWFQVQDYQDALLDFTDTITRKNARYEGQVAKPRFE